MSEGTHSFTAEPPKAQKRRDDFLDLVQAFARIARIVQTAGPFTTCLYTAAIGCSEPS